MFTRSFWRALRVIEHLTTGALITLYVSLGSRSKRRPPWLPKVVRWWHGRLYRALGIRLRIEGRLEPGCLLVGNHISWLDIPLLGAQGEIGFLSKSDVRDWPLIGWMAEIAGTRFIERGAHQSQTVLAQLLEDLSHGRSIMIFPEGTTTDGQEVRRFHPRLFSLARDAETNRTGARIQPIAIRYRHGDDPAPDTQAPYVGDDTLIANLARIICHPNLVAHLQFLPPIEAAANEPRRALAEQARQAIVEALELETEHPDLNPASHIACTSDEPHALPISPDPTPA